jgi:cytochrome c
MYESLMRWPAVKTISSLVGGHTFWLTKQGMSGMTSQLVKDRRGSVVMLLVIALLNTITNDAAAQSQPNAVERGKAIAQHCARCHAIGENDTSSHKDAPPFRTFHGKWPLEQLEEALAEGIAVNHFDMPEYTFTPDQASDFRAYLMTLR